MDSNSNQQAGITCPYCEAVLSERTQQEHLDECEVYETLMQRFDRNSVRTSLLAFGGNMEQSSEEELPASIRYLDHHPGSSSVSSLSSSRSYQSRVSTPEFRDSQELLVYPLRPSSKRQRSAAGCPVCFNDYSSESHLPLVLPSCGHTVCSMCLRRIIAHNSVIKCPVCRQLNFKEVDHLPTNFALLEFAGQKEKHAVCAQHQLEIVGYCENEDVLLCGACVFEHKDHNSYLLTDPRAANVAQAKRNEIQAKEQSLMQIKDNWQHAIQEVSQQFKHINAAAETHIRGLKAAEKQMINQVKDGTRACIDQVRELVKNNEVVAMQQQMSEKISNINTELSKLKDKKERFAELSMVEKLRREEFVEDDLTPPSFNVGVKTAIDLKSMLDYKRAIKNKQCPLTSINL